MNEKYLFVRVSMTGNRDGYYAVVYHQSDNHEYSYGPYPTPSIAEEFGRRIERDGPNTPQPVYSRMVFTGA